ncbi:MAG: thiolase domain-containing protein [Sulfolobales archaeon]
MYPIYLRPIASKLKIPYHFIAGLDANIFMRKKGVTREDLALIVSKNKRNGLYSNRAPFASKILPEDVISRDFVVFPLTDLDIASFVDAAIVVVVASETVARKFNDTPIWIDGIFFSTDSSNLETSNLGEAMYIRISAERAYSMAKIKTPKNEVEGVFVDDRYSYKELQHVDALKIFDNSVLALREGEFERDSKIPVNPYGGHLAKGVPLEASGISLLLDAVEYLRSGKSKAVVASWRGVPTFTGSVAVVSRK